MVLEEEGTFALFSGHRVARAGVVGRREAGDYLRLGEHRVLVRAKGRAHFQGGRGGVSAPFSPSEQFDFIEGTVEDRLARIASGARRSVFMLGRPIERTDFDVDAEGP